MGLFSIFSKKKEFHNPFRIDLHSHLIPGVDDGAKSLEESIELARKFYELGYRKIVTTPHIFKDRYENTPDIILKGAERLREALETEGIALEVEAAAEYNLDEGFIEFIRSKELLCFTEKKYVLFELPKFTKPCFVEQIIFDVFSAGYKPILAHPERYPYMHTKLEEYVKWREQGLLLQLNLNSLSGLYSKEIKAFAEKLLKKGLIDFVGSDCHRLQHLERLEGVLSDPRNLKLLSHSHIRNRELSSFAPVS